MADSQLPQKRKSAAMADFDIAPEPSDPLTFRSTKKELFSISPSDQFEELSSGCWHTLTTPPDNSRHPPAANSCPESHTNSPPSCTLRPSPKLSPAHPSGSPVLGTPYSSPPPPSAQITTSTAKLTALRAAAASKRTATTNPAAHTSTAPNRRIKPHDMVFQSTRRAQDLPKGSPVQLPLSSPTASKPMKRTISFDDRKRSTSLDVWTPISSSRDAPPTDWYARQPRRYSSHGHKRLKVTRPAEAILELQEQQKEWERGIKERADRMDKWVNPENELEESTSEMNDEREELEDWNKERAEQETRKMVQDFQRMERSKERERRRDEREEGVLQQQRCEDDGGPNDTQEREKQAQECFNQAPGQTAQEQSQQQQQGQGQARPQEVHIPDTVTHTTTQPTSSSSVAPPPQGMMDVQKLVAVSLDKELMSRVRKVTVTTVVYELDPASNTDV